MHRLRLVAFITYVAIDAYSPQGHPRVPGRLARLVQGEQYAPEEDVDLVELLSTCVDACQRGCAEIRRVAAALERKDGAVVTVDYKVAGDARSALTAADLAAQAAVVEPLLAEWPGLA
eukprot:CAMPEP_0119294784 /NCGR_PEP_ID=MMETSP1329-20130426/48661_1 /TAXON_ID=114041 /ORGANISM="Genus nov. species nov., Strain RCC1024" /LENGTH=117 /DNA_ID=CAMNT_0007295685 /DNA_START=69 /DNA_END=418 /DNA_ORIENTATION=+